VFDLLKLYTEPDKKVFFANKPVVERIHLFGAKIEVWT
jgi:hypothetical protein